MDIRRSVQGVLISVCVVVVSACSDGNPTPKLRPAGTASGVAYDGLILDGTVSIYAFNGTKGELLASGKTDSQGLYSFSIQAASQPILIEITKGRYVEEADGLSIPLEKNHKLSAVGNYVSGKPISMSVTYWTTLAAGLAQYKIKVGGPVAKAITEANAAISDMIGLDIISVIPKDPTDINNRTATLTPEMEYGFFEAALSKWTAYASEVNRSTHGLYSSIAFTQLAYDDILFDGVLDGNGTNGKLSFGSIPLTQTIYRHDLATYMIKMAQDSRNASSITADRVLPVALRLNDTTVSAFGTEPVIAIDGDGPIFTTTIPGDKAVVHGTFTASAAITDVLGLTTVKFLIDSVPVGVVSDLTAPSVSIDTTKFKDGPHALTITAINFAGHSKSKILNLTVTNTGTTLSNIVPAANSQVRGSITATADVTDSIGVQSVTFFVDRKEIGKAKDPNKPSTTINTTLLDGDGTHTLHIEATNTAGYTVSSDVLFISDNTSPVFSATAPAENTYHAGSFVSSATALDTNLASIEFLLDGIPLGVVVDNKSATMQIDTTKYTDHAYTLAVVAKDKAANLTTQIIPVVFDNTPPVITNVAPSPGALFGSNVLNFNFSATVTDLTLSTVDFVLDGNHLGAGGGGDIRSLSINSATLAEGTHPLSIIATDQSGHSSKASTSVTIDHTPPTSTVTFVTASAPRRCIFTGVTYDESGVESVTANGSVVATGTTPWTVSSSLNFCSAATANASQIIISEKDKAGNVHQYGLRACYNSSSDYICKVIP